jgi:hypothetical protein
MQRAARLRVDTGSDAFIDTGSDCTYALARTQAGRPLSLSSAQLVAGCGLLAGCALAAPRMGLANRDILVNS